MYHDKNKEVMNLIDETNAHKNEAAESTFNFLMNNGDGKGMFEQIKRYQGLQKAYNEDCSYYDGWRIRK